MRGASTWKKRQAVNLFLWCFARGQAPSATTMWLHLRCKNCVLTFLKSQWTDFWATTARKSKEKATGEDLKHAPNCPNMWSHLNHRQRAGAAAVTNRMEQVSAAAWWNKTPEFQGNTANTVYNTIPTMSRIQSKLLDGLRSRKMSPMFKRKEPPRPISRALAAGTRKQEF